jgi:hypothetical protein
MIVLAPIGTTKAKVEDGVDLRTPSPHPSKLATISTRLFVAQA